MLFAQASVSIFRGQKVGLTGANGVGKSSLFSLLAGRLHADAGDVEVQPGTVVAEVAQELPAGSRKAIDFVLDGDAELRGLEHALALAESAGNGTAIAELHERLDRIGGYSAKARAAQLLHGLAFSDADALRPIDDFSGGWRVRLNLARALMCRSDLLLLDEPTNHLDLDAIVWLEGWLKAYPGTLIVISHDRDFLDNVVESILHIEGEAMRLYAGNYSAFERQRALALAQHQAAYERQQREIARMHAFVDRFRAKATKARQAQSRLKALARMDEIAPAHVDSPFEFEFRPAAGHPDPALVLEDAAAGYADTLVLRDVRLALRAGSRIGLLGRNGAGKSTLIKLLAGEIEPLAGRRTEGRGLAIGYFAQRQLDQLRAEDGPLRHLARLDPRAREQELRDFLGGFDFRGDAALAPVGRFSGGEKSRLALALIAWQRPNVLLLDEPTNHLDIEMRHALTRALQAYEGAMVLVSHDRSLLRATCDELVLVDGGTVSEFRGDLDDYTAHLQSRASAPLRELGGDRRAQRRQEAQEREGRAALRRPIEAQIRAVEAELSRLSAERLRLENLISSPDLYAESKREQLRRCLIGQAQVAERLADVEARWLSLQEQLQALETG